jgi:HD-GYP domain-containing protein (c-di-GMP phosphodiesterase class II)
MFEHEDALGALDRAARLEDKLAAIHEALYAQLGLVERISVAAYDPATGMLRTFLASDPGRCRLVRYEAPLADSASLCEIVRSARPRVVDDLAVFAEDRHLHTRIIAEEDYRSSYTTAIRDEGAFWGLLFFNSRSPGAFSEALLGPLDVYAHLIAALVIAEMHAVRMLAAVVKTAHEIVHYRDPETGAHLQRVARYARVIAQHLAATGAASLDDAVIERIYQFAPLHDVGKIAIPDRILLKAARLTDEERTQMKAHTVRGREMIDAIARNFGLEQIDGLDLLRHIAESHHEAIDGSGYPHGLRDGEIPLEARIVAVADVFDALTSARPYKPSWSNGQAFAWLRRFARSRFDEDCVEALAFNAKPVAAIQAHFRDEPPPGASSAGAHE